MTNMILFLKSPRVPGRNHENVVSPDQAHISADIVSAWAGEVLSGSFRPEIAWAKRKVEQQSRSGVDHSEMLILAGFDPAGVDIAGLQKILESLLASIPLAELPPCHPVTGSSLVQAAFMQKLKDELFQRASAQNITLRELPPSRNSAHSWRSRFLIAMALFLLALVIATLANKGTSKTTPTEADKSPATNSSSGRAPAPQEPVEKHDFKAWVFLTQDNWRKFAEQTGWETRDLDRLRNAGSLSQQEAKRLQDRLDEWSEQVKSEFDLPPLQPHEIEGAERIRFVRNAPASSGKPSCGEWITNAGGQRSKYDNDLRAAAQSVDSFLREAGLEGKTEELRQIIDLTCEALRGFQKHTTGAFFDSIKANMPKLHPCPKGWTIPTLRDHERLGAIEKILSSPAFVQLAYDDEQVTSPVNGWKEVLALCRKGRAIHDDPGGTKQKLFGDLLKFPH